MTDVVIIFGASPRGTLVPLPGYHAAFDWGASNRLLERGKMVLSSDLNHHTDERVRRLMVARPRGIIVGQELDAAPNALELVRTLATSGTTLALGSDALPEFVCDRVVVN